MADATRRVSVRLSLDDGARVKSELRDIGETGQRSLDRIKDGAERASRGLDLLNTAVRAVQVVAIAAGVRQLVQAGDALTASMFRLQQATGSVAGAAEVYQQLYQSALQTGVAVTEGADAFSRFSVAARAIGATNNEVVRLVTGLQASAIVSGASAQEIGSATLQLAQGLASGVLQGDELRSLLESMPLLAEELAKELGVSIGQLREMGAKGELIASRTFPALLRATDNLAKRLEDAPLTVDRAFGQLRVSTQNFLGQLDQAVGLSSTLAQVLSGAASRLDRIRQGAGLRTPTETLAADRAALEALNREIETVQANGQRTPRRGTMQQPLDLEAMQGQRLALMTRIEEAERAAALRGADERAQADERARESARQRAQAAVDPVLDRLDPRRRIGREFEASVAAINAAAATGSLGVAEAERAIAAATRERDEALSRLAGTTARAGGAQRARNEVDNTALDLQRDIAQLIQQNETATERYARRMSELGELVERASARGINIPDETISRAANAALEDVTRTTEQTREATRQTSDTARELGLTFSSAFEDAIVRGKSLQDVLQGIGADLLRLGTRRLLTEPLVGLLDRGISSLGGGGSGGEDGIFGAISGIAGRIFSAVFHEGGLVGEGAPGRMVPAMAFAGAQRFHSGGFPGLRPDEVPAILQRGERVLSRDQVRRGMGGGAQIVMNITTPDASSFRASQSQILADMNRAIGRGRRGL